MSNAPVRASVNVCVEVFDVATGKLLSQCWRHNRVVDAGLNLLRNAVYGDSDSIQLTEAAVGTSSTPAAAGDTTLGAETFRDAVVQRVKGDLAVTLRFVLGSQQANGTTLREAGLFASDGTLYARVLPDAVVKTSAQSVLYTWTVGFESSEA